jgi:hypothetical protein
MSLLHLHLATKKMQHQALQRYFQEFLNVVPSGNHQSKDVAKWQSPWEDLAKSGYKPDMKYKSLINLLY